MDLATKIIGTMIFLPIMGLLLYTALHPGETALWGVRWRFKNQDIEPSDEYVKHNRFTAIAALVIIAILFMVFLFR